MKESFCCKEMQKHLSEKEVAITYCGRFRSYGIRVLDGGSSVQQILFCPWCGTQFKKELTKELSSIIFDELKLESYNDQRLAKEFKTDEWWKKRGL